ncbi:hypothetical protein DSO57_1039188 [Entomophthora muscae]|uniref:Uncharacterized protein n=1 Tax=Entomophthora muscae TaxID=34485 RepID=A0ACC2TKV9_9FUNG|nr:hypothetical protein DSO57_1039188 [Entomophthora muscae]
MLRTGESSREKVGAGPLRLSKSLMQSSPPLPGPSQVAPHVPHRLQCYHHSFRCRLAGYKGRGTAENVAYRQQSVTAVMKSWIKFPSRYQASSTPSTKFRRRHGELLLDSELRVGRVATPTYLRI